MSLLMRTVTLLALLGSSSAMALSGSDAFICDLIEYSENLEELKQANMEASKRGICGYAKTPPETVFTEKSNGKQKADREKKGKALFIGTAIVCVAKGKCEQPATGTIQRR